MSFNKNTWTKDYTGAKGLRQLSREDAARKGYAPKKSKKTETKEIK
jgi:hypothetical protein